MSERQRKICFFSFFVFSYRKVDAQGGTRLDLTLKSGVQAILVPPYLRTSESHQVIFFINVKKIYSDFFTNEIREIEAERHCFAVGRSSDEHECGSKTAHPHGFCAAFQPLEGAIFAPERLTFAKKEAPREKKALTFFHADIPF